MTRCWISVGVLPVSKVCCCLCVGVLGTPVPDSSGVPVGSCQSVKCVVVCVLVFQVRLYLTVLGFSVGFGALFAKTWRVYEIMTASNRLSKVTKVGTAA